MKVPFSWLKELVDIDVTAQELEEKLFSCGFEVEELIPLDAGISKVVVGKIVEMEKQEGTHLTKCVVDCGDYGHDGICSGMRISGWYKSPQQSVDERWYYSVCSFLL